MKFSNITIIHNNIDYDISLEIYENNILIYVSIDGIRYEQMILSDFLELIIKIKSDYNNYQKLLSIINNISFD